MKRFLILFILTAFLAIPAISLARVTTGAGVAPTLTLQVNAVHNSPSVMSVQNFAFTKGALFFNVSSVDNSDSGSPKMQHFNATVSFGGGASSLDHNTGKTTTISNISMDLSGLAISADNKPSAAMGSGAVNGTLTLMDNGTDGNGDPDPTQYLSFKGSYKMNVTLSGFVNSNPTSGTASFTVIISRVGPMGLSSTPNFNNSSSIMTNQISPQPVVVNLTLGAIPFKIGQGGSVPIPAGTADVHGTWNGINMKSDLSDGGPMTINLTQNGNSLTGWMNGGDKGSQLLTGSVVGKAVTLQFTDSSKGETVTITGALNSDGTLSGTYKSSLGSTGKWGVALSGSTPVGITGTWNVIASSVQDGPQAVTFNLCQYGNTILGDLVNPQGDPEGVIGSITGQKFSLTAKDYSSTPTHTTNITGTVDGTTQSGASSSGHFSNSDGTSGSWTATKGEPVTGDSTWSLSFSMTSGIDGGNSGTATLSLTQTGSALSGTIAPGDGSGPYSISGTVDGDGNVSLQFTGNDQDDNPETMTITGSVTSGAFGTSGAYMEGSVSSSNGSAGNWHATEQ